MFFDTNVLVCARFEAAPGHRLARGNLTEAGVSGEPLRISRQILREFLATVTRPQPWSPPVAMDVALRDVDVLEAQFEVLEDGPLVTGALKRLCREVPVGGKQIHDANIVATMLAYGERRLVTFNGADFRRYGVRIDLVDLTPRPGSGRSWSVRSRPRPGRGGGGHPGA